MYLAKESGGGVELYDAARDRNSTRRLVLLGELRRAIADGELELHYQPKADLATGRSTASRRSCAGGTPSAASSRRTTSSRSPSAPA